MVIKKLEYEVVMKTKLKLSLWSAIKMRISGMYRPSQNRIPLEEYFEKMRVNK